MPRRWSDRENEACLMELPAYRKEMAGSEDRGRGRRKKAFAAAMFANYKVLTGRNNRGLVMHMDHLNKVTAGTTVPTVRGDSKYFGIFKWDAEQVSYEFTAEALKEERVEERERERGVAESPAGGYFLSGLEKEKLLAFVGHGDFQKSPIIFFGNEEGLGGYELAYELQAKAEVFARHSATFINPKNWREGYYELPENIHEPYKQVLKRLRGSLILPGKLRSPMLEYQARIVKHLLEPDRHWFGKKADAPEEFEEVKAFYQNDLYRANSEFNLSLLDLRPFPRRNEGGKWPYQNLKKSLYTRAFDFESEVPSEYKQLREERAANLKRVIMHSSAGYIIGIGAKDAKKRFFEQNFKDVHFTEIKLTKDAVQLHKAVIQINGKPVTILLSDFFDHTVLGLEALEKLTKEHILF